MTLKSVIPEELEYKKELNTEALKIGTKRINMKITKIFDFA